MSIAGTWKISMDTPMGPQVASFTIIEENGAFKGTMTDPTGASSEMEDLSVDGNSLTFKAAVNTPMGKLTLGYSGTVDGESISGNFQSPVGPMPYTGERQQ